MACEPFSHVRAICLSVSVYLTIRAIAIKRLRLTSLHITTSLADTSVFFFPVKKVKVPVKKMRKGVREKTEVPVKILVNSTRETKILAREKI